MLDVHTLMERLIAYIRRDPMCLWVAALVVSAPLELSGLLSLRQADVFTSGILLVTAAVSGVRFYRERHPVLVGICVFLVLYSVLMLAVSSGLVPLPWS